MSLALVNLEELKPFSDGQRILLKGWQILLDDW